MPEGHTLHRHARLQSKYLLGKQLGVSSPQGRFSEGAAVLDGGVIERIEAYGKHLFYRWEAGHVLHVHLGLYGRFRNGDEPRFANPRLLLEGDGVWLQLSGPSTCELISPGEKEHLIDRLGPDPLRAGAAVPDELRESLARRRTPIGAALLDQGLIAGIGNVYRAELLFLVEVNPATPAARLDAAQIDRLWREARRQLRMGARMGRIVTVDPVLMGTQSRAGLTDDERLYVYGRDGLPCRRCATPVEVSESAGRRMWHCASCQWH